MGSRSPSRRRSGPSRSERGRALPGGPRARLFLALDPPDATRAELAAWRDELIAGRDDLRPVAPGSLHVTLVFLGWQAEADAERIAACGFDAARDLPGAALEPSRVIPLPPRDPRLFALDLADEAGAAVAVQAACAAALEQARFYRPEKRPFWPHITLARVKRGVRRAPPLEPAALPAPFGASRLVLYRSTLHPSGAVYEPLATADLAGP